MTAPGGIALAVERLGFLYPDGTRALEDISFAVTEGECVGLIGPNGAGKSTLLLHLNGLLPERIGRASAVRVGGEPVTERSLERVRREVGLLFQNPDDQIFCPTVFEDVAFGPRQLGLADAEVENLVEASLARVGLAGYGTRPPHRLSHGERRRVCLAGLLACTPEILLLDEPTSDLDPRGRRGLMALLRELPVTKLIASHDLGMIAELCSRVLLLDGGRLVCVGPARETLADERLMLDHGLEAVAAPQGMPGFRS